MTGEVVSEDGQTVVLEVGPGKVSVPASRVLRIERSRTALGGYRERAAHLAPDDVQRWLELAFWAQERDLDTQAQEAFERVLRLDPLHEATVRVLMKMHAASRRRRTALARPLPYA